MGFGDSNGRSIDDILADEAGMTKMERNLYEHFENINIISTPAGTAFRPEIAINAQGSGLPLLAITGSKVRIQQDTTTNPCGFDCFNMRNISDILFYTAQLKVKFWGTGANYYDEISADMAIGLMNTSPPLAVITDGVVITTGTLAGSLKFITRVASVDEETDNIVCDYSAYHLFEIKLKASHAYLFIDGIEVAHHTTTIPDSVDKLVFEAIVLGVGTPGAETYMEVDYFNEIVGVPF